MRSIAKSYIDRIFFVFFCFVFTSITRSPAEKSYLLHSLDVTFIEGEGEEKSIPKSSKSFSHDDNRSRQTADPPSALDPERRDRKSKKTGEEQKRKKKHTHTQEIHSLRFSIEDRAREHNAS